MAHPAAEEPGGPGRACELDRLRSCFDAAAGGEPQVVAVVGPPGIGKTALVERFVAGLDAVRMLRASCDEAGALLLYGAVAQLRRSAGPAGRDLSAAAADDPVAVGLRLLDVLGELQEAGPVVVVLDDAAWADPPSAIAIAFALRRLVADRVLAVVTVRDESRLADGLYRVGVRPRLRRAGAAGADSGPGGGGSAQGYARALSRTGSIWQSGQSPQKTTSASSTAKPWSSDGVRHGTGPTTQSTSQVVPHCRQTR